MSARRTRALLLLTGAVLLVGLVAGLAMSRPASGLAVGSSGAYTGPCAVDGLTSLERWRGRPADLVVDTLDLRRFSNLADPVYWTDCWGPDRTMVYGVALVPSDEPASLRAGADGAYDEVFRSLARTLVAGGQEDAWLRLGFEFNGDWFPWTAAGDPEAFRRYYSRVVDLMRDVDGADFSFVWNPTVGPESVAAELTWPGAGRVDAIGLDVYDVSYVPDTYPVPADASPEDAARRRTEAWEHLRTMDHGLDWWAAFAEEHHRPLALPEWGLVPPEHSGGGDDADFVRRLHTWAEEHRVLFESYFDASGLLGDHRLRSGAYPEAAAAYSELFGGAR